MEETSSPKKKKESWTTSDRGIRRNTKETKHGTLKNSSNDGKATTKVENKVQILTKGDDELSSEDEEHYEGEEDADAHNKRWKGSRPRTDEDEDARLVGDSNDNKKKAKRKQNEEDVHTVFGKEDIMGLRDTHKTEDNKINEEKAERHSEKNARKNARKNGNAYRLE